MFESKYIKYKTKYLNLARQRGGVVEEDGRRAGGMTGRVGPSNQQAVPQESRYGGINFHDISPQSQPAQLAQHSIEIIKLADKFVKKFRTNTDQSEQNLVRTAMKFIGKYNDMSETSRYFFIKKVLELFLKKVK
jgi:hypothetical protein